VHQVGEETEERSISNNMELRKSGTEVKSVWIDPNVHELKVKMTGSLQVG
jgi:hypothetical protein